MTLQRLNEIFSPDNYSLFLDIHRKERTFTGRVVINGTARSQSPIRLHAKDLKIESITIDSQSSQFVVTSTDEIEIQFQTEVNHQYEIAVSFSGGITDQMHGMYPCYFKDGDIAKELIATQFESHHAREVFPCIDEPEAKATFDVTLTTEAGVTVLGNMPIKEQATSGDRLVTTFDRTPKMSSYLLAWVYGEMHKKSGVSKGGVEVNIWATPAQSAESLDFALDIATRTIDFFDTYFGVPYPLPKCDHVALPDFSSGAMENWGLITYREVALLAEPGDISVSSKHRIAAVIAHELSHQWFGNLVTMRWWNNLWLNESFANLMEYIAIDALEPSWNVWFDFASYETVMSLRRDAIDGVQPVQVEVGHPDEISTLFDPAIVYAKGSRLLRMLERYIGTKNFQIGLRAYFKKHAYGNTEETDLWESLAESSGEDITKLMTPWISQPGFPVITLDSSKISQEQFFVGEHTDHERLWPVPLGSSDPALPRLLETSTLSDLSLPASVRLNSDDSAHFITHYSAEILRSILDDIAAKKATPIQRLQLLNEQILLARGGRVKSDTLVPLLSAYEAEDNESVWDLIAATIGELKKFVENDDAAEMSLKSLARALAHTQFERLGWHALPNESEADTKLRSLIIGLMIYGEDEAAVSVAAQRYENDFTSLDPELRALILSSVIRHSSDDTAFNKLLDAYVITSSAELQHDIAAGLTSTQDPQQIQRLLTTLTDSKIIRSQDVARWFVYLIRNRWSRDATWKWMTDNWDWITKTFGGDKSYDDYPRYAASGLVTASHLEAYQTFFGPKKDIVALTRVIDLGINEIRARVELIERDGHLVRQALIDLKH